MLRNCCLLFLLTCYFLANSLNAQTFIAPSIGMDFSKLNEVENNGVFFQVVDKEWNTKSLSFGARVEQQFSKSLFLSLSGNYQKVSFDSFELNFASITGHEYQQVKAAASINYLIFRGLHVGTGIGMANITGVYPLGPGGKSETKRASKIRETKFLLSAGYSFKNFLLELTYWKHQKRIGTFEGLFLVEPIDSISFSVSYLFKILDRNEKSKNKVRCPRI